MKERKRTNEQQRAFLCPPPHGSLSSIKEMTLFFFCCCWCFFPFFLPFFFSCSPRPVNTPSVPFEWRTIFLCDHNKVFFLVVPFPSFPDSCPPCPSPRRTLPCHAMLTASPPPLHPWPCRPTLALLSLSSQEEGTIHDTTINQILHS